MQQDRRETLGAISMFLLVLLGNSAMFTLVSYTSAPAHGGHSAFQLALIYSATAFLALLPSGLRQGAGFLKTTRLKLYGLRALLEYGAFLMTFTALGYVGEAFTLPMHTAINFMTPLLATVITIAVLKEKSHVHTWLALAAGFLGVLIITRPGALHFSPGVFYVLGAALGFSVCGVVIKLLTATEPPLRIAIYMTGMTTLFALPAGIAHWKTPAAGILPLILAIGVIGTLQQLLVAKAIAKVPLLVLIPLNFLQLVFITGFSYAVYGKLVDGRTVTGTLVILGATLYNALRTTQKAATIRHENP